jgi:hypothetical protein
MGLDIRLPIGLMFSLIGLLMTIFGAATGGSDLYAKTSLGININLIWGIVLLIFGGLMLFFSLRARKGNASGK